jgi:hypothetical protein
MADTKIIKGMRVREKPQVALFEGVVTEFRVDGETGDVQYKVTRQVMNPDGTPKLVEDRHGDSCDHDEKGNQLMDAEGKPLNSGKLKNIRTEMIPVYEERFFTREQLEAVMDAPPAAPASAA